MPSAFLSALVPLCTELNFPFLYEAGHSFDLEAQYMGALYCHVRPGVVNSTVLDSPHAWSTFKFSVGLVFALSSA